MTWCFLSSRRHGDPRGSFQSCESQEIVVAAMLLGQDGAEGGPACRSWELPSAATTALSRGCHREQSAISTGGEICPLPTREGNFFLNDTWQSHVWNSLHISPKEGKTAKILSGLSQAETLKSSKSACLEKESNTLKLRSGQLRYFDFDPLYFLFCVC